MYLLSPEAQPGLPGPVLTATGRFSIVLAADKCTFYVFVFLEDFNWSAGSSLLSPEVGSPILAPHLQNNFGSIFSYIFKSIYSLTPLSHLTSSSPVGITVPLANSYLSIGLSLDVSSSRRSSLTS